MPVKELTKAVREEEPARHRLQIELSPEAYQRLLEIRSKSDAASNTELVRNALRLYEWFQEIKGENYRIQLVKDDVIREVEIML